MNVSERWFEEYLDANEYKYERLDDGDQKSKTPDYRIRRGGTQAVVEVKEFKPTDLHRRLAATGGQTTMIAPQERSNPVRNKIGDAASQLKKCVDTGLPLVVLLANPNGIMVPLQPGDIQIAMYGNLTFMAPIHTSTGTVHEDRLVLGRDGKLTNNHAYLSAIAVLAKEGDQAGGDYLWVDVVETLGATDGSAVRVPDDLFNGPRDRLWRVTEMGSFGIARQGQHSAGKR